MSVFTEDKWGGAGVKGIFESFLKFISFGVVCPGRGLRLKKITALPILAFSDRRNFIVWIPDDPDRKLVIQNQQLKISTATGATQKSISKNCATSAIEKFKIQTSATVAMQNTQAFFFE